MNHDTRIQDLHKNTLFPGPLHLCFSGTQQAVSDIEYLIGQQCFGFEESFGNPSLQAILFEVNRSHQAHQLPEIFSHRLINEYHTARFSDLAGQNGLNLHNERSESGEILDLPVQHIPYLLDGLHPSPTQLPYRLGVARRILNSESDLSSSIAEVAVQYFTSGGTADTEYHTIWIVCNSGWGYGDNVQTWSVIIPPDLSTDVHSLLQTRDSQTIVPYSYDHSAELPKLSNTPQNRLSIQYDNTPLHHKNNAIIPRNKSTSQPIITTSDRSSILTIEPTEPYRIPGAPPFETRLPSNLLSDITMEELLTYYPEHVLHWPGLSILYTHYRFHLTTPTFTSSDLNHLLKKKREVSI